MAIAMEFIRNFLKKWETRQLIGYIPCEKRNYRGGPGEGFEPIGQSGVTIATGLDLGQQTRGSLIRYGIVGTLFEKLSPYLEKTRYRAIDALKNVRSSTILCMPTTSGRRKRLLTGCRRSTLRTPRRKCRPHW